MIFVTLFFAFGIDLIAIQVIYSDLDSKSVAISYKISKQGTVNEEVKNYIEETYLVSFRCISNCSPLFGDTVTYIISKDYAPVIIKNETMTISIQRNAVIGYLN